MNRVLLILTLTLSFGFFNLPKTQGETVSAPIITSFESEKPNIGLDQSTILKWSVSGNPAPILSIDNGVGVVTGSSVRIPVAKTTKYFLTAINSAGIAVSEGVTITVDPKFGLDLQSPTTPPNLKIVSTGVSNVELSWDASTDNLAVEGYKVFRDGVQVGDVRTNTAFPTSYSDTLTAPDRKYDYQVSAFDAAGNESARSNVVVALTKPLGTPSAPAIISFFHHNKNGVNALIARGDSTTLVFRVTGSPAPILSINRLGFLSSSTPSVSPTETTTYVLTATNSAGSANASLTVTVADDPFAKLILTSSQSGTVSGVVTFIVNAPTPSMTPAKIEYYLDDNLVFTGGDRFLLNTNRLTNGIHRLRTKAFDGSGNVFPSASTLDFTSSNPETGRKWTQESILPRFTAGMAFLEFKDKMWLLGANGNDVWSSEDGVKWNLERENSPNDPNMWSPRYSHAVTVFNNKMWVMGGLSTDAKKNDVWSSEDGRNWSLVTAHAAWSSRYTHSATAFNGKMWVMGGIGFDGFEMGGFAGVWSSSDGVNWNLVTADPGWKAGNVFTLIPFNNQMWAIGGTLSETFAPSITGENVQVWSSSDGVNWTRPRGAVALQAHHFTNYGAVVFNDRLWVMGGRDDSGLLDVNEVFSSGDGVTWQRESIKDGWRELSLFGSLVHKDTIWILDRSAVWKLVSDSSVKPATSENIKNQISISNNIQKRAKLIKTKDSPRVYYVTEKDFKRWMPTETIFLSYGNLWSDVVVVDQAEIDANPDTTLIREVNDSKVYKLENGLKRWITSPEAFIRQGFSWDLIAPVNRVELNHYPVGENIN